MDELKPCPFCGNKTAVRLVDQNEVSYIPKGDSRYVNNPYFQVVCCLNDDSRFKSDEWESGCGSSSGFWATKVEAIAAWNRRPAPENNLLTLEHVDCKTCQFEDRQADEEPCRHCKGAYPSRYARKPEQEEHHG